MENRKNELKKLKTKIVELNHEDKLILGELLVSELSVNDNTSKDSGCMNQSNEVFTTLYQLINNLQDDYKKEKLLLLIDEIKKLPIEYQSKLITRLINLFSKLQKEYSHQSNLNECADNGHSLTPWKKIEYERYEENPALHSRDCHVPKGMEYIWVKHVKWERNCTRCGYAEKVDKEPIEVREERLEFERQEEIKVLEKRLSNLKNKH